MPSSPFVGTIKRLFAVSGNRCAFPGCSLPLVDFDHEPSTVTGEICYIRACNEGDPRYDPSQPDDQCHGFDNLILMCPAHHKVIDENPVQWTVERLIEIKRKHEAQHAKAAPSVSPLTDAQVEHLIHTVDTAVKTPANFNPKATSSTSTDPTSPTTNTTVNTDGGAYVEGNVEAGGGTFAGRDQHIHGDNVAGDKVLGAQVLGDKIERQIIQQAAKPM